MKDSRNVVSGYAVVGAVWAAMLGGCGPGPAPVRPFAMGTPDVVLLVTGGNRGMMEICDCPGPMTGGLARRSGLFRSYRAAFGRTIAIDSGDVLWVEPEAVQNRYVLEGYRMIGYDAIVLGDHEWMAPGATLAGLLAASPQTVLSTSVATARGPGPPVTEALRRQWGGVKVAVVSAVGDEAMRFVEDSRKGQLAMAALPAVAGRVKALKADGYAVVLVAHGDEEYVEACAGAVDADLIVRGHTAWTSDELLRAGGKPVVKVGGTEQVGAVALKLKDGRIARIEYRAEAVDAHWPLDERLVRLFREYVKETRRQEAGTEGR